MAAPPPDSAGAGPRIRDPTLPGREGARFAAVRAPRGGQFQVNTYTQGSQEAAAVAADGDGNFIVAWHSEGSAGSDSGSLSIQARRLDSRFRDGFEAGATGRWSVTAP